MFLLSLWLYGWVFAQNLEIIPKAKTDVVEPVEKIGNAWWHVWDEYNKAAADLQKTKDLWAQMASWIFTRDTLLDYLAYLIKFLSEIGIFVGACFIVYAGYLYATSVFTWNSNSTSDGNKAIKNAIVWVLVITFSYAIMKAITAAFLT